MMSSANIVVEPLNNAPAAANDEFTIDPANPLATQNNVIANDTDIDGDALTANPRVRRRLTERYRSIPTARSITCRKTDTAAMMRSAIRLFDGKANSNVATVTLHDIAGNFASAAADAGSNADSSRRRRKISGRWPSTMMFTTAQDTPLDVPADSGLLANDSDPEGSPLTVSLFSDPIARHRVAGQ